MGFMEDPGGWVPVSCVRILAMMGIIFRKGFPGFLFRMVPFILVGEIDRFRLVLALPGCVWVTGRSKKAASFLL